MALINMLNSISSLSALNVTIIPIQKSEVSFIVTLNRQKLKVRKQELSDECFTLCRVRKILRKDETFDMFKLPIRMNEKITEDLLKKFDNMPPEILDLVGKKPTIKDLQVQYPAIILSPIAIYQ